MKLGHAGEGPERKNPRRSRGSRSGARGTRTPDLLGAIQAACCLNVACLQEVHGACVLVGPRIVVRNLRGFARVLARGGLRVAKLPEPVEAFDGFEFRGALQRRPGPGVSAAKTRRGTKHGLASRAPGDLRAPLGGATRHAGTLAIADEGAASGRRPGLLPLVQCDSERAYDGDARFSCVATARRAASCGSRTSSSTRAWVTARSGAARSTAFSRCSSPTLCRGAQAARRSRGSPRGVSYAAARRTRRLRSSTVSTCHHSPRMRSASRSTTTNPCEAISHQST